MNKGIHIKYGEDNNEVQVWWEDFMCLGVGKTEIEAIRNASLELAEVLLDLANKRKTLLGSSTATTTTNESIPTFLYAQRLATSIWEKHWERDSPDWAPLPDLLGVLTQIDNMVSGMTRKKIWPNDHHRTH